MRRRIQDAADQLSSDAWIRRDVPGELERVSAIRQLVNEQLADDVYTTGRSGRERVGRQWVLHFGRPEDDDYYDVGPGGSGVFRILWPSRSPDQLALEAGVRPFLEQLTPDQRALISWLYGARYTLREVGAMLNISHVAVLQRRSAVTTILAAALRAAFPEVIDERSQVG